MSGSVTGSSAGAAGASLRHLLTKRVAAAEITQYLDGLVASDRVKEVLAITGKGVKLLYDVMAGAPPATVDDFVPTGEKGTVIYEGRNSLPVFSRFQKRLAHIGEGVVGYNHQFLSFVTGPGYFLVRGPSGDGEHGDELLFDYTVAPPLGPKDWPRYKSNNAGLSRQVFGNLKDYVRPVAAGVFVGKAFKLGLEQGAYFSLSRAV
jgi:hypothetical protein